MRKIKLTTPQPTTLGQFIQASYYFLIFCLMSLYTLSWLTTRPRCTDYNFYVINSNSMAPTLKQGDLIMIVCDGNYKAGRIVTFRRPVLNPALYSSTITHRIIKTMTKKEGIVYLTRGDANFAADGWISQDEIVGRVKIGIPALGTLILWLQSDWGKFLGIYLPVAGIFLLELRRLFKPK